VKCSPAGGGRVGRTAQEEPAGENSEEPRWQTVSAEEVNQGPRGCSIQRVGGAKRLTKGNSVFEGPKTTEVGEYTEHQKLREEKVWKDGTGSAMAKLTRNIATLNVTIGD